MKISKNAKGAEIKRMSGSIERFQKCIKRTRQKRRKTLFDPTFSRRWTMQRVVRSLVCLLSHDALGPLSLRRLVRQTEEGNSVILLVLLFELIYVRAPVENP